MRSFAFAALMAAVLNLTSVPAGAQAPTYDPSGTPAGAPAPRAETRDSSGHTPNCRCAKCVEVVAHDKCGYVHQGTKCPKTRRNDRDRRDRDRLPTPISLYGEVGPWSVGYDNTRTDPRLGGYGGYSRDYRYNPAYDRARASDYRFYSRQGVPYDDIKNDYQRRPGYSSRDDRRYSWFHGTER